MESTDQATEIGGDGGDNELSILGPWGPRSITRVLVMCHESSPRAIKATLKSLFGSTIQNFQITCVGVPNDGLSGFQAWTREDTRVSYVEDLPGDVPQMGAVLVLPAGWVLTPFSLLALWKAVDMPKVEVLRSVVEGAPGTLEFWSAEWLAKQGSLEHAEPNARRLGVEKWISAEGLGIHSFDQPAPRVFFRRGEADKHIVDVVVHDGSSRGFVELKDKEIASLKAEVRGLNRILSTRGSRRFEFTKRIAASVRIRVNRFR